MNLYPHNNNNNKFFFLDENHPGGLGRPHPDPFQKVGT